MNLIAADLLVKEPFAFFVGSGISCAPPTRIDNGATIVHALCETLAPDERTRARLLELSASSLRFEVLLHYVERCSFTTRVDLQAGRARISRSQAERSPISSAHTECGMRYSCHSTR